LLGEPIRGPSERRRALRASAGKPPDVPPLKTVYQGLSGPGPSYVGLAHTPHRRLLEHDRGETSPTLVSVTFEDLFWMRTRAPPWGLA